MRRKQTRALEGTKAERRRIRRGRQPSVQQGQSHGHRVIVHVKRTNWMPTFEQRHRKGKLEAITDAADVMRALRKAAKRK